MNMQNIRCELCGVGPLSGKFWYNEEGPLYWANPKLIEGLKAPKYFCGPDHSTQWFLKQMTPSNNESTTQPII
jgi:hypothetical protein